jgi:hypothetical protein
MIVYYLYIVSVTVDPAKTDPPPVVDADAMLPLPICSQFLETVPGENAKIIQSLRGVK